MTVHLSGHSLKKKLVKKKQKIMSLKKNSNLKKRKTRSISFEIRVRICELKKLKMSNVKIAEECGLTEGGVRYILERKKMTGTNFDRKRSGRKKLGRSKFNIKKVKKLIKKKPNQSIRTISKKLNLKKSTTFNILKKDLKLKPYKMMQCQLLNEKSVVKRLERCKALKKRFKNRHKNILFSDEKIFTIEPITVKIPEFGVKKAKERIKEKSKKDKNPYH